MPDFAITVEIVLPDPLPGPDGPVAGAYVSRSVEAEDAEAAAKRILAQIRAEPQFTALATQSSQPLTLRIERVTPLPSGSASRALTGWAFYPSERTPRRRRRVRLVAIMLFLAATLGAVAALPWLRRQLRIDTCLDNGGRWDYAAERCEH